jgi:large subunit ribosomal protein L35
MSRCQAVSRPLARQISRQTQQQQCLAIRSFSTTVGRANAAEVTETSASQGTDQQQAQPGPLDLDPDTVLPEFEAALIRAGKMPVGSQRRRMARRTTADLPFEQLPYQAFQEARKILAADREEKLVKIREEAAKIAWLEAKNPDEMKGGQARKDVRLASLKKYMEELKILADVNDPVVKKRFEDGLGKLRKCHAQCS